MKVKIRKAQPGETPRFISKLNKFIKKTGGQSDTIDAYIDSELNNGTSPEEVISALVEFKIPREKIEDIVYEMYDAIQESDNYNSTTTTAPYDEESSYNKKVKDKVKVEEVVDEIPESEKYGYYDSNNLGSKLAKETDFDEDGEYEDGGQYMDNSIFPKPKQPYFVGMDANAVPGAFAFGGTKQSKSKYINDYIKKLKKAAEGDQVENSEFYLPPAGSIGDPMGNNTKQNQMFAGTVKQMGNEAMMKKQAEESYQNMVTKANGGSQEPHDWVDELHGYGEALQHTMSKMDENAINTAIMKKEYGRGGRIRRANKALFGTPHSIPGVNTSYEFGPLGGIRKATAEWDLQALGDLVNFLPGAYGMMPGMNTGNWKSVSYPSQVRQKVITSVNNKALDEVAGNTKSSSATQGHLSSNKKGLNCPPGAVYDASSDQCIGPDGLPVDLLGNPFANPYASIIPGSYQSQKQQTSSNNPNGSNTAWMGERPNRWQFQETWTPEFKDQMLQRSAPWAPGTDDQGRVINYNYLKGMDPATGLPFMDAEGREITNEKYKNIEDIYNSYNAERVPSSPYSYLFDEEYRKANNINKFEDYTPEQQKQIQDSENISYLTRDKQGNEYSSKLEEGAPDYEENQKIIQSEFAKQEATKEFRDKQWDRFSPNPYEYLNTEEDGGFIDSSQMQRGVLQKFISGGNEYAYGGALNKFVGGGFDNWAKDKFNIDGSSKFKLNAGNAELINPFNKNGSAFGSGVYAPGFGVNVNMKPGTTTDPKKPASTTTTTTTTNNTAPGQQQFTPEQIQQFLQYQKLQQQKQGQQGNMVIGPPKKLGFGFSKDFSYTQGFSPNWNVPEGTKKMRQEVYKDRGKWFNPFDTKKITDWYADDGKGAAGADGAAGTAGAATVPTKGPAYEGFNADSNGNTIPDYLEPGVMSGSNPSGSNPSVTTNTGPQPNGPQATGTQPNGTKYVEGMKIGNNQMYQTNTDANGNPMGVDNKGRLISNDAQSPKATVTVGQPVSGSSYNPDDIPMEKMSDDEKLRTDLQSTVNFDPNNPTGSANKGTDGTSQPQQPVNNTQGTSLSNPGLGNPFLQNNGLQNPTGPPVNQFGVIRRQQGGFIPSYAQFLEYGGYIPKAGPGIVVDQPDFSDPNFVGRTIEQNAYSFDKSQLGADLFGKGSLTDIFTKGANAWSQAKQDNLTRDELTSTDAAKPNSGQTGFGSAEVTNFKGAQNQYGKNIQNIGDEGNNVIRKMGGAPNKQYQKGRVYTLTLKQIKEIEAAEGKIEYLK
jgi:hypothetical protein